MSKNDPVFIEPLLCSFCSRVSEYFVFVNAVFALTFKLMPFYIAGLILFSLLFVDGIYICFLYCTFSDYLL